MVYSNKVVAAVKVNGQILREQGGHINPEKCESGSCVTLPFGSEYSIFIKNLNSVRIQVRVSVDGKDATEGTWLVVGPNSSIDLERFIRDGNFERGNRFKFIERTRQIEKHRGIQADDGLIRVEYRTEMAAVKVPRIEYEPYYVPRPVWPRPWWPYPYTPRRRRSDDWQWQGTLCGGGTAGNLGMKVSATANSPLRAQAMNSRRSDVGITVPGSESQQKFVAAPNFETYSQSEVIVLHLRGEVGGKKVTKPVTVKTKPTCVTCGKTNKGQNQFCSQCGTALTLI